MSIDKIEKLNATQYYIVMLTTDAYAEGITGINYYMGIYHNSDYKGWNLKKDLSKTLASLKKNNKNTKKKPNSNIGKSYIIKVMKRDYILELYKNVRRYSIYLADVNE